MNELAHVGSTILNCWGEASKPERLFGHSTIPVCRRPKPEQRPAQAPHRDHGAGTTILALGVAAARQDRVQHRMQGSVQDSVQDSVKTARVMARVIARARRPSKRMPYPSAAA